MTKESKLNDEVMLDPWVGRVLGGRYRIVARIGAGGMGVVYRAWDHASEAYAVIKMPRRELIGDPKFLQRFEQEFSALRILSHPVVVPVMNFGNDAGMPFAAMPYLAGGSLKQRRAMLQDGGAAPEEPSTLWRWLPAIAQSLDFVHSSGYVHRDVKPDNILFDGPGSPYLSDFGIAKIVLQAEDVAATRGLTGTGFALGTPEYMAPELISGTKADAKVDQYALAVMTYELLAGRKPFDGPTPAAVMIAHATGKAPHLAAIRPSLPKETVAAVERGMAKNPAKRFESCKAFAERVLATIPQPAAVDKLQLMCPQCSRLLNVKPDWAGKQGNCPRCKTALTIGVDLRSLWIPGDRAGAATPSDRVSVGPLGGTPSRPLPVARTMPPAVPTGMPRMPTPPPEPTSELDSLLRVLRQQFGSSIILQGLAAATLAFTLLGVTMPLLGGNRKKQEIAAIKPGGTEPRQKPERQPQPQPVPEPVPEPRSEPESQPVPLPLAETTAALVQKPEPALEPEPKAGVARFATPVAAAIDEATTLIRQAYEEQYTLAAQQRAFDDLIDLLAETASATKDPVRRYALLLEAEGLCVDDLQLTRAIELASERARQYEDDDIATRQAVISRFAKADDRDSPELFEAAVALTERCRAEECFPMADDAAALAVNVAKFIDRQQKANAAKAKRGAKMRGGNAMTTLQSGSIDAEELLKRAAALQKEVRDGRQVYDAYTKAVALIETSPDEAAAQALVGRYLCFTKGSWTDGLDHLAKSQIDGLADIAARHLAMNSREDADVTAVFEIAGDWWELVEGGGNDELTPLDREAIKAFAASLYRSVLDKLTDPTDVALVRKRIKGIPANDGPGGRAFSDLLTDTPVDTEVPTETKPVGSSSRRDEFSTRSDPKERQKLLEAFGGNADSEAAVEAALEWLIAHQLPDGGWSLDLRACPNCGGQCSQGSTSSHAKDRSAATALALLPFLGRGCSHKQGPYKKQLEKGLGFLSALVVAGQGKAYGEGGSLYSQGLASIALCEAYGLTRDRRLAKPAQAALDFIMVAQDPDGGGWRYAPKQAGDTSASGWQFTALETGHVASLNVAPLTIRNAIRFLDHVQGDDGATYGYTSPGAGTATSAIGLLCRMYVGWKPAHPPLQRGAARLGSIGPGKDLYFDYYATQVLRRIGGDLWSAWNPKMRDLLLATQATKGHEAGSWHDGVDGGHGATAAGRLYCTSLATLILEAYYRHADKQTADSAVTPELPPSTPDKKPASMRRILKGQTVSFDYSTNNGLIAVGTGAASFGLMFSKAGDTSIYVYKDHPSIVRIARVKDAQPGDLIRPQDFDSTSRTYTIHEKEIFLVQNQFGHWLQARISEIKDDSRQDDADEVTFEYMIYPISHDSFPALSIQ